MSHITTWATSAVPTPGALGPGPTGAMELGALRLLCRPKLVSLVRRHSQEGGPPQQAQAGGTLATPDPGTWPGSSLAVVVLRVSQALHCCRHGPRDASTSRAVQGCVVGRKRGSGSN